MKIFACLGCLVASLIAQPCNHKECLRAELVEEHKPYVFPTSKLFYPRRLKDVFPDSPEPKMDLNILQAPQTPKPKPPVKSKPRKTRYSHSFIVMR